MEPLACSRTRDCVIPRELPKVLRRGLSKGVSKVTGYCTDDKIGSAAYNAA